MKYMTFNSLCSDAGLANLLTFYGVDTLKCPIYYFGITDLAMYRDK